MSIRAFVLLLFALVCGVVFAASNVTVTVPPQVVAQPFSWMACVQDALLVIVTVFGAIITASIKPLLTVILGHFGIQKDSAEFAMIDATAENAARLALQKAKDGKIEPTHNAKVDAGFAHMQEVLDDKLVQTYGIEPIKNIVSAKLNAIEAK